MTTKEKIIKELKEEFSDLTTEELEEMAEMELKSAEITHREESARPKERKPSIRKPDEDKIYIINTIQSGIEGYLFSTIVKPEREINFTYNGADYTITLTKHRK